VTTYINQDALNQAFVLTAEDLSSGAVAPRRLPMRGGSAVIRSGVASPGLPIRISTSSTGWTRHFQRDGGGQSPDDDSIYCTNDWDVAKVTAGQAFWVSSVSNNDHDVATTRPAAGGNRDSVRWDNAQFTNLPLAAIPLTYYNFDGGGEVAIANSVSTSTRTARRRALSLTSLQIGSRLASQSGI
jgi:hypothetical protein